MSAETRHGLSIVHAVIICVYFYSTVPPSIPPFLPPSLPPFLFHDIVQSVLDLVKYVFTIPGELVLLSNRICQDPLESFFGQ